MTVFNPGPGGGASNGVPFTVTNPVPAITALDPISKTVGDQAFTLVITGSGFVPSSVVAWAGQSRSVTYVGSTRLEAAIYGTDLATARVVSITVSNRRAWRRTSNQASFTVSGSVSGATSLWPVVPTTDDPGFILDAMGSRFITTSAVQWMGPDRGKLPQRQRVSGCASAFRTTLSRA